MATTFTRLLSPIKIGPKVIKNRILVTAHVPGLEKNNLISDEYILYQHAKAKGGAGLQISGATAIHSTGSVGAGRGLNGSNPKVIIGYKRLAKAIHQEGGRFLIQLGHSAATVNDQEAGRPLIAPSSIQSQLIRETPEIMTIAMIEEIIHSYYLSAKHVKEGDLDGVEILAAFGFLVGAFMSPFTNKRTDKYGGSLENRLKFPLEVVDAVRKGVGKDLIVGMRLPGDERVEGGLNQDSMISISEVLCRNSELDYLNIIVGTNYDRIQRMEHWPPTPAPPGLFVPLAAAIKAKVAIPVFTTGRITDPVLAETILANNHADMIGMTRAQIADPKLVQKIMENRLDDIRPCIGANLCISQATEAKPIRCIHNPIIGRETLWQGKPESKKLKKVTIIGGGPAGLEAARVAAKIGHHVTLFEQSNKLGGQFRIWSKAPLTAEFIKSINWYEAQLRKLQVKVRLNRKIEENEIEKFDTDVIIMATGSKACKENLTDGNIKSEILVLSPEEVFIQEQENKRIVLIDEGGGRNGISAIDAILKNNLITIVSTDFLIGEMINPNLRTPIYKKFLAQGVKFIPCCKLARLLKNDVVIKNIYSNKEQTIKNVDTIINWRGNQIVNNLQAAIERQTITSKIIGDCRAPRQVHIAIAEGAMAACEI